MIARFEGTRLCPITGQQLAHDCWNMQHAYAFGLIAKSLECRANGCRCWCHTGGPSTEDSRQADAPTVDYSA